MSNQQEYSPPPGPPPGPPPSYRRSGEGHVAFATTGRSSELQSNNPFRGAHSTSQEQRQSNEDYAAPPGPPPSHQQPDEEYTPPAGPPPSQQQQSGDNYAPPPGPPPSHQANNEPEPPPYDPWMAVPDAAFLPPPPAFHSDKSPTSNASEQEASRATIWCNHNPLWTPRQHTPDVHRRISLGDISLTAPPGAKHVRLSQSGTGRTVVKSEPKCPDTILLSDIPLYTATTGGPKTIYFEVKILGLGPEKSLLHRTASTDADAAVAIGYAAPPYPSWRQPGWHRGSLGVHSDDGRRYVDDPYGGQEFTRAFRRGDVVGIWMAFQPSSLPSSNAPSSKVEVFFTRNGKRDGGWSLDEERDREQDGGSPEGLQGERDLLAAVGVFGAVECEVRFRREDWKFRP